MQLSLSVSHFPILQTGDQALIQALSRREQDDQVNAALWKVRCFLAPPTALFHPLIMGKVASFWLKQQINF